MAQGAVAAVAGGAPDFAFERYFLGHTRGWGVLQDRGGGMLRQFTVDLDGVRTDDGALRLTETIDFDDGERMHREWTVRPSGEGGFRAWAPDVDGVAIGEGAARSLRWRYIQRLAVGGRAWRIAMDDRMYALPDDVVLSRVRLSKWGVTLASMTVTYRRVAAPALLDETRDDRRGDHGDERAGAGQQIAPTQG